ncbi:MAG: cupin domain-containing protein [Pseudomonadota bacterium]|nr:cupin domain-containing protein [Pseudomonadota bacterium]
MAVKPFDINAELATRPFFRGRSPDNEKDAGEAFADLGAVGNGRIFAGSYQGDTPWERHGQGDEVVQVLDGETWLTLLEGERPTTLHLRGGMLVVVPQGVWHRFHTPVGVTVMTVTPLPTDFSTADDPRDAG